MLGPKKFSSKKEKKVAMERGKSKSYGYFLFYTVPALVQSVKLTVQLTFPMTANPLDRRDEKSSIFKQEKNNGVI